MDEVGSTPRSPKPFFTVAAWFSLLVPLLGVGLWYYGMLHGWGFGRDPNFRTAAFAAEALVFALSFLAGCVSLWGVKANGALVILPPALLGILASAVLEASALISLFFVGLPTN